MRRKNLLQELEKEVALAISHVRDVAQAIAVVAGAAVELVAAEVAEMINFKKMTSQEEVQTKRALER